MQLIKLNATPSTNEALKKLWQDGQTQDWTILWAENQFQGRGQQGSTWQSEPGKNLTFSILKYFNDFDVQWQFLLNMAVSLSIFEGLQQLGIPGLAVKWPNDIMSGSSKICGILIENMVKAGKLRAAIVGIGLNVNQETFKGLPDAGSLKTTTGKQYKIASVLEGILKPMKDHLNSLSPKSIGTYKEAYESCMYRIHMASTFEMADGSRMSGMMRGVTGEGKLRVEFDDGIMSYQMKEIRLLN